MNISTPVGDKMKNDIMIDDIEIIKKSLIVAKKLDVYLDDLKIIVKNSFSTPNEENKYHQIDTDREHYLFNYNKNGNKEVVFEN